MSERGDDEVPDHIGELNVACDRCGKGLLIDSNVRYEVTIEVKAAYDPMELTEDDLDQDLDSKIDETIEELKELSEQEANDQVYKKMTFHLCPACQKEYIDDPI